MFTLMSFAMGTGFASGSTSPNHEVIVGENNLAVVAPDGSNVPEIFRSSLNAFGLTTSGCTVTHIGNKLALTAAHCYSPSPRASPGACAGITIWWGHRAQVKPKFHSQCKRILLRELNKDRDVLVLELDSAPEESLKIDTDTIAPLGLPVTIFSHPRARPLEWSGYCSVEDWDGSSKGANQFNHRCDTEPGSSGAAIIDSTSGRIVGVHNGGGDNWNYATFTSLTSLKQIIQESFSLE
jgi:hypothetical protein